ncbi:hypothetical protein TNCV_366041 [Trichonephila clavipes]|nr:hypothetical protein TNCV_366041 [Trichonephila clavipes]
MSRPSGTEVSEADCGATVPGREVGGRLLITPRVFSLKIGVKSSNIDVTCTVLKAKANDKHTNPALSHDEFPGP